MRSVPGESANGGHRVPSPVLAGVRILDRAFLGKSMHHPPGSPAHRRRRAGSGLKVAGDTAPERQHRPDPAESELAISAATKRSSPPSAVVFDPPLPSWRCTKFMRRWQRYGFDDTVRAARWGPDLRTPTSTTPQPRCTSGPPAP